MYKTNTEAQALVNGLKEKTLPEAVEVVLCPPFTALVDRCGADQGDRDWPGCPGPVLGG